MFEQGVKSCYAKSIYCQCIFTVHQTKPGFPGPHKLWVDFPILCRACKTAQGATCSWHSLTILSAVSAETVIQMTWSSSFKVTVRKASGGVNYKLYGLLHFINVRKLDDFKHSQTHSTGRD